MYTGLKCSKNLMKDESCKRKQCLSFCYSPSKLLLRETITHTVSGTVCPTKATQVLTTSQTTATGTTSFMSTATQITTMPGSTVTTKSESLLTPANLTTGLTASTGVLVALLTGTILGWVSTCVYWRYWYKHLTKQQE